MSAPRFDDEDREIPYVVLGAIRLRTFFNFNVELYSDQTSYRSISVPR